MTTKARKHIRLGALMMAIAVVGALAALIVLTNGPGAAQAHEPGNAAAHGTGAGEPCEIGSMRDRHDTLANTFSQPSCDEELGTTGNGNGGQPGNGNGSPTPTPTRAAPTPTRDVTPIVGSGTDATALPHAVRNLAVVPYVEAEGGIPQEQLKISWDAPATGGPVTGYRVDLSIDGKEWFAYIGDHAGSDLRVIYGDDMNPDANEAPMSAMMSMYFRVFAFNKIGTGPGVAEQGTTKASRKPEPATDLVAEVVQETLDLNQDGDTNDMANAGRYAAASDVIRERDSDTEHPEEIELSWNAPEDPPGAPVTGYEIQYSDDGKRWFNLETVGRGEAYLDTSLIANETRYYRIYALNSVGKSLVSENSATETSGPSLTPVLPEEIKHVVMSPNATDLRITWATPPDPLGDAVARYEIQAKSSAMGDAAYRSVVTGSFSDNLRIDEDANTTTFVTSSQDLSRADGPNIAFAPGAMVDVRIRPGNRAGFSGDDTSAAGDEWLVVSNIPWGHPNLPLKQSRPRAEQDTAQNEGRSGLDVYWYPAKFVNGQGPDEDASARTTFASQVRYVLVIDNAEEAEADSYRMEDGAATGRAGTRGHVGADDSRQTTNDDDLQTEHPRDYTVYPVRALGDLSPTFSISGRGVSTNTLDVIRGFPSMTEESEGTNRPLPPGTPTNFFVSEDGHTEIRLAWSMPIENPDRLCQNTVEDPAGNNRRLGDAATADPELEDDGSECGASVITAYRIYRSTDGITDWAHLAEVPAAQTQYVATQLTPGQRYYFRVSAVNSNQEGNPTEHASAVTEQTDMPTPPGGLVAQAMSSTQLKMCWFGHNLLDPQTGEALDEDLPVLGYRITYVGADGNEVILVSNTMSKDTVFEDPSELAPETTRIYRVRGINLANLHLVDEDDVTLGGTLYAEASATTDEGPVIPPDTTLKAPTNVMATSDATGTLTLSWEGGENADFYILIAVNMSNDAQGGPYPYDRSQVNDPTARTGNVTGLSPGAPYLGIVVAVKVTGTAMETLHGTGGQISVQ